LGSLGDALIELGYTLVGLITAPKSPNMIFFYLHVMLPKCQKHTLT
jgi:hypothetical protein